MSEPLKSAVKTLNDEQMKFLETEFSTTKDEIAEWDEDKLGEVYDALCDMELEDGSDKSGMASELVTLFGNEIAKDEGLYDEDEFENGLKD